MTRGRDMGHRDHRERSRSPGLAAPYPRGPRTGCLRSARGIAPAQRQALSAPDVAGQVGSRLERDRGVDRNAEQRLGTRNEAELIGDAAAGEGVNSREREPRLEAQRPFKALRTRLVGRDALGSGSLAGTRQAYG